MKEEKPILQVRDLSFFYESDPKREILSGITFSIFPESITAVIGLSGCGKRTLCQILCGIIPQCIAGTVTGEVRVAELDPRTEPLSQMALTIGYMMQDPDRQLFASTVEDELAFGPENLMLPPREIRRRVDEVMDLLEIRHLALKNPGRLSGGQKQLVAAGALLTMEPDILIMDEPVSHVDAQGRKIVLGLMKKLRATGKTLLVVEHDYEQLDFADQWLVIENGRLRDFGAPEEIRKKGGLL